MVCKEWPPVNKDEWRGVWVFLETWGDSIEEASLQLLGEGRRLADRLEVPLTGIIVGHDLGDLPKEAIYRGADQVIVADSPDLLTYNPQKYSQALYKLIVKYKPEIVLFPGTRRGREVASSVAIPLRTGLTADCTAFDVDERGNLIQIRPAFGGKIFAKIVTPDRRPQMASVRPNVFPTPPRDENRSGEVIREPVKVDPSEVELLEFRETSQVEMPIDKAKVVVAGGYGLGIPKGLEMLRELARLLGGALAGSRKIVDLGWLPRSRQVGQTGKTIRPDLYIAVGISGTSQHMVGVQSAKVIVAINRDPKAPIFESCDYGVVADYREVIPLLLEELRKRLASD